MKHTHERQVPMATAVESRVQTEGLRRLLRVILMKRKEVEEHHQPTLLMAVPSFTTTVRDPPQPDSNFSLGTCLSRALAYLKMPQHTVQGRVSRGQAESARKRRTFRRPSSSGRLSSPSSQEGAETRGRLRWASERGWPLLSSACQWHDDSPWVPRGEERQREKGILHPPSEG